MILSIFKPSRHKKCVPASDVSDLKRQIAISARAMTCARSQFESVVDPTLIDCYIYELNAAQLRYQYLLRSLKQQEQAESRECPAIAAVPQEI